MSKLDALRAMREARYAEDQARAAGRPAQTRRPVAPVAPVAPPSRPTASASVPADGVAVTEELCGHRNMGGRTCTREQGHSAKSHRYS